MAARPSSKSAPSIDRAIEVFVRAVAFVRSFTHPYEVHRVENLWVMRDAPRRRAEDYRREEWVAHGVEAAQADSIVRRHTRGRFAICAIRPLDEPDEPIRAAYKAAGYRLGSTEALMAHRLARVPSFPAPLPIERVLSEELAARLNKSAGRRQMQAAHLRPDAALRQYVALDGDKPVAWAASITVGAAAGDSAGDATGNSTWVQSMYVQPPYRRRGIGKAILAKLLRDDRAHGSAASYLLASHAGALLYPNVGYEGIGELMLYTRRR